MRWSGLRNYDFCRHLYTRGRNPLSLVLTIKNITASAKDTAALACEACKCGVEAKTNKMLFAPAASRDRGSR